MPRPSRLIDAFLRLSWGDRWRFAEAVAWLLGARLMLLFVPFRKLASWMGRRMAESPEVDSHEAELGVRVSWAVCAASRHTPWQTKCLAEAIAAKTMLKLRRVPSTLYLGVAKNDDGELEAHAWLRCGSLILTGGRVRRRFTVIATFAE